MGIVLGEFVLVSEVNDKVFLVGEIVFVLLLVLVDCWFWSLF